jgi:hypothetical protein
LCSRRGGHGSSAREQLAFEADDERIVAHLALLFGGGGGSCGGGHCTRIIQPVKAQLLRQ